jgi:hypothetical protein
MNSQPDVDRVIDTEEMTRLLRDPVIVRVVTVLDIARLSVLELFEYGLTKNDVNHALAKGVIKIIDEEPPHDGLFKADDTYYQKFLSSKVMLTELGKYLLDCIKDCECRNNVSEWVHKSWEPKAFFAPEAPHMPR